MDSVYKWWKCTEPGCEHRQYLSQDTLDDHTKNVHRASVADRTCKICGRVMGHLKSLPRHMSVHEKERKMEKCELCGAVMLRWSMYDHRRACTGTKIPLKCSLCPRSYLTRTQLARHTLSMHPGPSSEPSPVASPGSSSSSSSSSGTSTITAASLCYAEAANLDELTLMPVGQEALNENANIESMDWLIESAIVASNSEPANDDDCTESVAAIATETSRIPGNDPYLSNQGADECEDCGALVNMKKFNEHVRWCLFRP